MDVVLFSKEVKTVLKRLFVAVSVVAMITGAMSLLGCSKKTESSTTTADTTNMGGMAPESTTTDTSSMGGTMAESTMTDTTSH